MKPRQDNCLFRDLENNTLFTYKVKYDRGSAPNPFGGVCTLAICKPRIRATAKIGDVILGLGCKTNGDDERRIVYCMVVEERLTWKQYNERCSLKLQGKIPADEFDPGDCIWQPGEDRYTIIPSSSRHGDGDFKRDVETGKYVLLSSTFWYFGAKVKGDGNLYVPGKIDIVPYGRSHQSTINHQWKQDFQEFFCQEIRGFPENGRIGMPAIQPWRDPHNRQLRQHDELVAAERSADLHGEEDRNNINEQEGQLSEQSIEGSRNLPGTHRKGCGS